MEEEKNIPFYPSHINTLKIGYGKEATDLLRFREFIEIRENGQRLTGELPKGMFRLSYAVIEEELNFSRWTARKIMKYFLDNGIIECVEKSRKKGEGSLYIYTTVYYYYNRPNNRPNDRPNDRPNLSSISNGSEGIDRPNDRPNDRHSKKHILNTYIKNNNMSDSKESDEPPGAFKNDNNNSNKTNENTITTKSKGEKEKEKNSAKKKEKEQQIKEVVEYLNLKANRNYRPGTTKTKSLISARLKDYTVEDLKAVIDFKVGEWLENEKMNKYLRPETLFNETKFENYINELPSQATKKSSQSYLEDNDVELSLDDIIKINLGKTNKE